MYKVYIADYLMPIAPEKITYKVKNKNSTIDLLNGSEVNIPKKPGLTDISFELRLPGAKYPFANFEGDRYRHPTRYINLFESIKSKGLPCILDITREDDNGNQLYATEVLTTNSSIVRVGADGKAPEGLSAGTLVITAGGVWRINSVNSDGSYNSEKVAESVNVNPDGKAPSGLSTGTYVITAGGLYKITGVNEDGSYESEKVSEDYANVQSESTSDSVKVTLENYTITDDAADGTDIMVSLNFKMWQDYSTLYIVEENGKMVAKSAGSLSTISAIPDTYTTKEGDTLESIAKTYLGDSSLASDLYSLNKDVIEAAIKEQKSAENLANVKAVRVSSDGKAPSGLSAGTYVVTAGGLYQITAVLSDGSYKSERVGECVDVGTDGSAPSGLSVGTYVATAGGLYQITAVKSDGTYESKKVVDEIVKIVSASSSVFGSFLVAGITLKLKYIAEEYYEGVQVDRLAEVD